MKLCYSYYKYILNKTPILLDKIIPNTINIM